MPMSDKERRRLAQSGEQQIQGAILSLLEQHPDGLKLGKIAAVLPSHRASTCDAAPWIRLPKPPEGATCPRRHGPCGRHPHHFATPASA